MTRLIAPVVAPGPHQSALAYSIAILPDSCFLDQAQFGDVAERAPGPAEDFLQWQGSRLHHCWRLFWRVVVALGLVDRLLMILPNPGCPLVTCVSCSMYSPLDDDAQCERLGLMLKAPTWLSLVQLSSPPQVFPSLGRFFSIVVTTASALL